MYRYCTNVLSTLYRSCITCDGQYGTDNLYNNNNNDYLLHPIELLVADDSTNTTEVLYPILTQSHHVRLLLTKWLPISIQQYETKLQLLYSTNYHGRTLEQFYYHVQHSKHTILLCEVINKSNENNNNSYRTSKREDDESISVSSSRSSSSSDNNTSTKTLIVGMYASQTWKQSNQVYGDGNVFLFRIEQEPEQHKQQRKHKQQRNKPCKQPFTHNNKNNNKNNNNNNKTLQNYSKCWKWKPIQSGTGKSLFDASTINHSVLLEQFMVGTNTFISMGGNANGSSGLRINENLSIGESSTAPGFYNEPLHIINTTTFDNNNNNNNKTKTTGTSTSTNENNLSSSSLFHIGLLEVYGFVRQIDGKFIA